MPRTARTLIGLVAFGFTLVAAPAWAGPATDTVQHAVDRVLQILQDPDLKKPAATDRRRAQMREVARGFFDFEEMARRALARHWAARTPEERRRFTELFAELLEASYVGKIESYGGEKILYLGEQADGDLFTVRSKIVTLRGTEIPVDYRLHKAKDGLRVYDVVIEGVSLIGNYRTQFHKIITQSSYEELVKKMEQKQLELAEEQKTRKTRTP